MLGSIEYLRYRVAERVKVEAGKIETKIATAQAKTAGHRHGPLCKLWCAKRRADTQCAALETEVLLLRSCEDAIRTGATQDMLPILDRVVAHFKRSVPAQRLSMFFEGIFDSHALLRGSAFLEDYNAMVQLRGIYRTH